MAWTNFDKRKAELVAEMCDDALKNCAEESTEHREYNEIKEWLRKLPQRVEIEENLPTINDSKKHNYARTTIKWKDSGIEEDDTIIGLSGYDERNDNIIFYYCENENELKKLQNKYNGEDFWIIGTIEYLEEL